MSLTYPEANLFLRFGEDMRWSDWPPRDFGRWVTALTPIPGYTVARYTPTPEELSGNKWTRA